MALSIARMPRSNLLGLGNNETVRQLPDATLKKQLGRFETLRPLTTDNISLPLLSMSGMCKSIPYLFLVCNMSITFRLLLLSTARKVVRPARMCLCMCVARVVVVFSTVGTRPVTTLSTGRQLLVIMLSSCPVLLILVVGLDIRT